MLHINVFCKDGFIAFILPLLFSVLILILCSSLSSQFACVFVYVAGVSAFTSFKEETTPTPWQSGNLQIVQRVLKETRRFVLFFWKKLDKFTAWNFCNTLFKHLAFYAQTLSCLFLFVFKHFILFTALISFVLYIKMCICIGMCKWCDYRACSIG